MPAGYDAEVAELFRDLRSASGLSEADLAAQLATRTEVVQALEQGALYALPPWPETYRVVTTYGTLLNLDVRPLLRRIYAQVDAGVVGLEPKAMPDVPFMAPPETVETPAPPPQAPPPPVPESVPAQQRQPAPPPQQWPPQPAPDRRDMPRPPQPQQPPQARPQAQPQWPPQQRGAPPGQARPMPPQPPPLPRPGPSAPRREGRAPVEAPRPQGRPAPSPQGRSLPPEEQAAKALPWKPILRWGIVGLVILALVGGAWMWLAKPGLVGSGPSAEKPGGQSSNKGTDDPNDPRSRKADRLPGPS
jgi:hypothetical protein